MLGSLAADAVFGMAIFAETLAALSWLRATYALPLREELEPMLTFYQAQIAPIAALPPSIFTNNVTGWYRDFYLIGATVCFLFLIRQARAAMAPSPSEFYGYRRERSEAAIDATLPAALCAFASCILALTFIPLATPLLALWLLIKRAAGRPSWFAVTTAYYINLIAVAGLTVFAIRWPLS